VTMEFIVIALKKGSCLISFVLVHST